MKKLYQILAVALVGLAMPMLSACGDDDFEEKVSSVKVMSATSVIPVMGGTGTINVAGEGITATSSANWLKVSVSGNTVKMVGEANTSKQSRNALVTISAANGDKTAVNVSQVGMVINVIADDRYLFEGVNNPDVEISNQSNVIFKIESTDSWIKMNRTEKGYTLNVEDNTGDELRKGSVTLKYADYSKQINVVQWGKEYPFTDLNTATYKNKSGVMQTKTVTIEKDPSKDGQYLVKGLVPEGNVTLMYNQTERNWYVSSGYYVGTKVKTGSTKVYLRCMMSAADVKTGERYWPTTISTSATYEYRMQFSWSLDQNDQTELVYTRNSTLSSTYSTNGIIVIRYKKQAGAGEGNRDGSGEDCIEYYLLDLKFSKK